MCRGKEKQINRTEAIEHLKVVLKTCDVQDEEAVEMAIKALVGKDTNVPTKSALDHIHNVVMDDAYKRGYEDGRKDAIPIDWIQRYINACEAVSKTCYKTALKLSAEAVSVMLDYWKEEQA